VHDGRAIIESTGICEYINDQWSDPALKPTDNFGRAQMRLWAKHSTKACMPLSGRFHSRLHFAINARSARRRSQEMDNQSL
jgi:glutathione S-transferase